MNYTLGSAASNVSWAAIARAGRVVIQLLGIAAFARLLPPFDFGLLAMGMVVTNFVNLVRDMGTSAALIQKDKLSAPLLDTVFWSNILFGMALAAAISISAPLIAFAFRAPALQLVLIILSLALPISAIGTSQLALLERTNRFRLIAAIEVSSAAIGTLVGVVAAWKGLGVYSLVLQTLVTAIISTCQLWAVSTWRPKLRWRKDDFETLWRFSGNLVAFNIVNYFARNADKVLIGRFLGPIELGVYDIVYRLMLFPLQNLTYVVNRALFPIYSRRQNDLARMGHDYLMSLTFISVIAAPLMLGLWSVRDPFVISVLGQKWLGAAAIIAWLAPTGYLQSLTSTTGIVLMATGRTDILRTLGIINSTIHIMSFVVGLKYGAVGVARAYFFANIVTSVTYLHYTLHQVNLRLLDVVRSIIGPLAGAFAMVTMISVVNFWILPEATTAFVRLLCLIPLGIVIYSLYLLRFAVDVIHKMKVLVARSHYSDLAPQYTDYDKRSNYES